MPDPTKKKSSFDPKLTTYRQNKNGNSNDVELARSFTSMIDGDEKKTK